VDVDDGVVQAFPPTLAAKTEHLYDRWIIVGIPKTYLEWLWHKGLRLGNNHVIRWLHRRRRRLFPDQMRIPFSACAFQGQMDF
jgi:hypothetical protein